MEANDWKPGAAILHSKASLNDSAKDCGRAATLEGIFDALRSKFGLSVREARGRLTTLQRHPTTSLQDHATQVERLMDVAYAELPRDYRRGMTVDTFTTTLGDANLRRHLLVMPNLTLEEAVRAGTDFLQIQPTKPPGAHIRTTEREPETTQARPLDTGPMATILAALAKLTQEVKELQQEQDKPTPGRTTQEAHVKPMYCWGCGETGHIRRGCPNNRRDVESKKPAGNEYGPRQ